MCLLYDDNVISLCSVSLVLLLVYSVVIIYFIFIDGIIM